MSEPMEFWIPINSNGDPTHVAWHEDPGKERDEKIFPSVIHVIEKSAYDARTVATNVICEQHVAELEQAKAEIARLQKRSDGYLKEAEQRFDINQALGKERDSLRAEVENYKQCEFAWEQTRRENVNLKAEVERLKIAPQVKWAEHEDMISKLEREAASLRNMAESYRAIALKLLKALWPLENGVIIDSDHFARGKEAAEEARQALAGEEKLERK